jgi:iron complex transport system permease protein
VRPGAAVSIVWTIIGFVGLVAPHLLRMGVTSDNRLVLPLSALLGGLLLCAADTCARLLSSGEIPVGTLWATPFSFSFLSSEGEVHDAPFGKES